MDMILDFLVEYYVWVLIISVFLILVLIGYIADQKRKLKKIKEGKNIEQVQPQQPSEPVAEPVSVNTPVNDVVTPSVEATPVSEVINTPINDSVVQNVEVTPVMENVVSQEPIQSEVIDSSLFAPIGDTPVIPQPEVTNVEPIEEVISEPQIDLTNNVSEETVEAPTIDINEPIEQIEIPETEIIETIEPTNITEPVSEVVISEPENIVNTWEPELTVENKDIISDETEKDSI